MHIITPPFGGNKLWYDLNRTLSYNCLLNFIIGQRGCGKTYALKKRAISQFLKNGSQFVYLRRFDTEVKQGQIDKFFADISQEFEGHELVAKRGTFYCDDEAMGYYMPLSRAQHYKSVPFPKVELVIFDEFIIDQGLIRYLPNEVETFNEMYSTIARLRDVPVFFLSNAITFTNPYFLYFSIKIKPGEKLWRKGDVLVEYVENKEFVEVAKSTRFAKVIAEKDYAKYAIENKFLRDNDAFVSALPGGAKCTAQLLIEGISCGLFETPGGTYYISDKIDNTCKIKVNIDKQLQEDFYSKDGGIGEGVIKKILLAHYQRNLLFTNINVKNLFVRKLLRGT